MAQAASAVVPSEIDLLDKRSRQRAIRAIRSLPFNSRFYADAKAGGLNAESVFARASDHQLEAAGWFHNAEALESSFRWLITLGVLRREVDGQGLTARIRLTPLGRQLLDANPELPNQRASPIDRIRDRLRRHWPALP
ncbi:MAG: Npun_F0494 family protein [Prochlorococcus sp.]